MTFGARYIANIIQFAGQQGANRKALLKIVGIENIEALNDEALRYDATIYNAVIEKALVLTRDEHLGLHIGEYLSLAAAGLISNIVHASATIREALDHIVTFANLGCQALPFSLIEQPTHWELTLTPSLLWQQQSPQAVLHTIDAVLVFTLREFYNLTHQKQQPLAINLTRNRPQKFMEYERIFKTRINYSQSTNAILLSKKLLEAPIVTSDYYLLQVLVQHAELRLRAMESQQGFFNTVKQTVVNLVKPSFPTLEEVAANLNMSVRTLQRRLKEEGYSYNKIINELKKQFAMDYIQNKQLSVNEIAYLLGYNGGSAFNRAFKKWTGKSPGAYRKTI